MIAMTPALPGLSETPPSIGAVVKTLYNSGTFAESFASIGLSKTTEPADDKLPKLLKQPKPLSDEKAPGAATAEPKQPATQAAATLANVAQPTGLPAKAPTSAQPPPVEADRDDVKIPRQSKLANAPSSLAFVGSDGLSTKPLQASPRQAETRPLSTSTSNEAKQSKAKPVEKTAVQASASKPSPTSHTLTSVLASASPLTAPSASLASAQCAMPLAVPATPTQTLDASEAKASHISSPVSLPAPVSLSVQASASHASKQTPVDRASLPISSKAIQASETHPQPAAKTNNESHAAALPETKAQSVQAAPSKQARTEAAAHPEGSISLVNTSKPTQTPATHPSSSAKTIRDVHAVSLPNPASRPQPQEAAASNPPAQVPPARSESGDPAIVSSKPVQVTPAQSTQDATAAPSSLQSLENLEKKTPSATAKHATSAPLSQSAIDAHAMNTQATPPSTAATHNTLQTEHIQVAEKPWTATLTPPALSSDIALTAIKPQQAPPAESIPATAQPSLAMYASRDAVVHAPALAHTTLQATPTVLEVGVPSGTHGWLRIRAEMGDAGVVQTSIAAATKDGREMLHRDLPAMNAFLETGHLPVTLQIAHATAPALTSQAARTNTEEPATMSFAPGSFQEAANLLGDSRQHTGAQDHPSRQTASRSESSAERESFGSDTDESPPSTMPQSTSLLRATGGWLNVMA